MLELSTHPNGAVVLRSLLLASAGIPHAFSTRIGGISRGPFASLNFGNPNPCDDRDPPENIRANYELLLEAAGCPGRELVEVHQVHGCDVHTARRGHPSHDGPNSTKADAIATSDPSRALAVRTADCVPVLLASSDGKHVAAVHAGWRGVVSGVVPAAVRELRRGGEDRILAAIGPSIGPDAFEVGSEVVDEFRRVFADEAPVLQQPGHKQRIDLKSAIALQFRELGVVEIDTSGHCTVTDRELFFSHRRDNGLTGRMASVIASR